MVLAVLRGSVHLVAGAYQQIFAALRKARRARVERLGGVRTVKPRAAQSVPVFIVLRYAENFGAVILAFVVLTREDVVTIARRVKSAENRQIKIYGNGILQREV